MNTNNHHAGDGNRILRLAQVVAKTNIGRSSIYELAARGEFPRPVKLSARSVGWLEREIDDWIAARASDRDRLSPEAA